MDDSIVGKKPKKSKTEAATYSGEGHDLHRDLDEERELSVAEIVIPSDFADESADRQAEIILERFNDGVTKSAFTLSPAPGRALARIDMTFFALGHRNQVAELIDPRGQRYSTVYTADLSQTIKSMGTVLKTAHYFGAYGKHVLNVPAGHYARAFSKNRPVMYGEGPHVIIDPTFQFNEQTGFINQNEPYIQHSTIHILRVPAGKVAKVWIGTLPYLYESRRTPYVTVDAQFKLVVEDPTKGKLGLFFNAGQSFMEHGSIKRLIPHTGEVAITYKNGTLTIISTPTDGKPIIIDSATHEFNGFISTSLQTCLFPSKETKMQALEDNARATADEVNLKIFQTRDSLRVGVVLVVAFKITDPEMAISKLGRDGIISHIENVSFADMGKAIQLSTLQEVMYFTQNRPNANPKQGSEAIQTIQDRVRNHLARDLQEYGIELARLQIETMKVLDSEIAKKLAGQSVTSAEFTTKQATLVKEYDIKTTEARLKAETDNIALSQANQARIAEAQAKLQAAQRSAEALIIAADAQRRTNELIGQLYMEYPELLELELLKIASEALQSTKLIIMPQSDIANASPFLMMSAMAQKPPSSDGR